MFRRAVDDFRTACRENRYLIREYVKEDPAASASAMEQQAKTQLTCK